MTKHATRKGMFIFNWQPLKEVGIHLEFLAGGETEAPKLMNSKIIYQDTLSPKGICC